MAVARGTRGRGGSAAVCGALLAGAALTLPTAGQAAGLTARQVAQQAAQQAVGRAAAHRPGV
ncbi:hypothetical protein GA0115240_16541, partial [Streptomyces sp. DvalAA-14]|uniref:hypothetical protein n=1 Tax=Streptomyces sp. DvalAA-14 TaxID=1839759 RepID=UPI00081B57F7